MFERVKSWYIRWPWAAYRFAANCRLPLNVHIDVRWEGFGAKAAVYRVRREQNDRLVQLYDEADTAGDSR